MSQPEVTAEAVFALAIEMPAGSGRDQWVAQQCAGNSELVGEVQSLLEAYDNAGDFLAVKPEEAVPHPAGPGGSSARQSSTVMIPALCAGAYLRGEAGAVSATDYVAGLPEAIRQEARERIEAGMRVRHFGTVPGTPVQREDVSPPSLAGFQVERKLGEGGLGVVFSARDEKLRRRVAIKVLRAGAEETVRQRLLTEARNAAALRDPAVVTIYSVMDEAQPPAIIMEMVEGFPIDRFASQLNFEQKARLLREVARGLSVAHASGVIHRDLKPENIIVGPEMRPRILDFGLALTLDEARRRGRGFEGTPLYASPEQVRGDPLTTASDIFSFGSLMFKVLSGRAPFGGKTAAQTMEAIATTPPPFLRDVTVGIPEDLQAICLACLAWNPADRPSAADLVVELGRFLVGEPVRLKPKLYGDLLRQSISEYSNQVRDWASQSIISPEERDSLEVVHRRLLADEDHWLIDARRITFLQTLLSAGTWLAVVASVLMVWLLRKDLGIPWRWLLPLFFTITLIYAGNYARRAREMLSGATFLAGAALSMAPCALALLAELHWFGTPQADVRQLFDKPFTNQQAFVASLASFAVSTFGLWRLQLTGFAWTTATMATTTYLSFLLLFNWLDRRPEIQALWCLPLVGLEIVALAMERKGRVRWTMPFHLVALFALTMGLDVMALNGPTVHMVGIEQADWSYWDHGRQVAVSVVVNGLCFLGLMWAAERSFSLDLRRAAKWLEVLAILHVLSALFINAMNHRSAPYIRLDVTLYVAAALGFALMAPFRSRWRMLVGGLVGCGLGSYLLVDLGLVNRKPFIIGLGFAGVLVALATFLYVKRRSSEVAAGSTRSSLPLNKER
jgi:serine/threonine protein kinase